jgi:hypothetical protein
MAENKQPSTIKELADLFQETMQEGREILGEMNEANRELHQSAKDLCDSFNRFASLPPPQFPRRRRGWF